MRIEYSATGGPHSALFRAYQQGEQSLAVVQQRALRLQALHLLKSIEKELSEKARALGVTP